ncbi:MAG: hypothetical protein ABJA60_12655, partial [Nitrosospira sp.]
MTKLLSFARRVPDSDRFPQVLVIYSSGYLRLKPGADPTPPLPFGQSLVLGPAICGTSTSFAKRTLFFYPQLQRVAIDTTKLNQQGAGNILIRITSSRSNRSLGSATTNQIMNLSWELILEDPSEVETTLQVMGAFEFTEDVTPDPLQTQRFESVRLLQISTMFIDKDRHDVNALRFSNGSSVTLFYDSRLANVRLPGAPSSLDPPVPVFESIQTDQVGRPNGKTPSYKIRINSVTGPT